MSTVFRRACCAWILLLAGASGAAAIEPFPAKPIRIIVPSAPGGALDITTRLVAQKMGEKLGQSVIVDNRPGGDTLLGTRLAKDAPADGYTILAQANGFTALPALKLEPGYDPIKNFTAIGPMLRSAQVMWASVEEPDRSVADFIARAKANPGKLNYAHGGVGSPLHLGAAQFIYQTGIDVPAVPYKGSGAALPDVAAGRVNVLFAAYTGGAPYLQAGKLKPLGVTGTQRLAALPNVPTFKEQGVDFTYYFWLGLLAPAGTSKEAIQKLAEALKYATSSKELTERFRAEGSEVMPGSSEEFEAYLAKEVVDTARAMRDLKVKKE
jgi:tripartite-type tricarboxylate transporter receptor subunit TctC